MALDELGQEGVTEERTIAVFEKRDHLHHGVASNVIRSRVFDHLHIVIGSDQRAHVIETHVAMTLEVVEPPIRIFLEFAQFAHRLPFGRIFHDASVYVFSKSYMSGTVRNRPCRHFLSAGEAQGPA